MADPSQTPTATLPELLAPAGDPDGLRAAVNHGADAVYLGLADFNARARAANFEPGELAEHVRELRPRGVKVYVTVNTLASDGELDRVAETLAAAAMAGADALIVQDLGVARLAREVCPAVALHASTQTSVGTPEGAAMLAELGFERLIAPRELDLEQIGALAAGSDLGVETFVHGAHCLSWSGQCHASRVRGGRSANRGRCAHPCRLPYGLEVDCRSIETVGYPLSPTDLVGDEVVRGLAEAGVCSLKIEGRLKRPEYVAASVKHYRRVLDRIAAGGEGTSSEGERRDLLQPFSRTSTTGHLEGRDHRRFVDGARPGSVGLFVGQVARVRGRALWIARPELPLKAGDGVAIVADAEPVGGRLYRVEAGGDGAVVVELGPDADLAAVRAGDGVWRTDDPALTRRLRLGIEGRSREARPRRQRVDAVVRGAEGAPLELTLDDGDGCVSVARSDVPLQRAHTRPLDAEGVRQRVGRLGDSPFELAGFSWEVLGEVSLPLAEVNRLRREAAEALAVARASVEHGIVRTNVAPFPGPVSEGRSAPEGVYVHCRTAEQVRAAADGGAVAVLCEPRPFEESLAALARERGLFTIAVLPRTEAPGEPRPPTGDVDGVLVRTLGQLRRRRGGAHVVVGDATLNAVNGPAAAWLLDRGVDVLVPGRDLRLEDLTELRRCVPADRLAAIIHERPPLFHTVHCLFAAHLADARSIRECGQACRGRTLGLLDERGRRATVVGEVPCRNTVYGEAVGHGERLPPLREAGVVRCVVELLDEDHATAMRTVRRYAATYSSPV